MKKKKRVYPKGCAEIGRLFDHIEDEYRASKRREWLKEHYGKKKNEPKKLEGGEKNEDNS